MRRLRLTENGWVQRALLSEPESGMGYQQVELFLKDGRHIPELIAWYADTILLPDHYGDIREEDIAKIAILHGTAHDNPEP